MVFGLCFGQVTCCLMIIALVVCKVFVKSMLWSCKVIVLDYFCLSFSLNTKSPACLEKKTYLYIPFF